MVAIFYLLLAGLALACALLLLCLLERTAARRQASNTIGRGELAAVLGRKGTRR